jgi:hypothetical protein
MKRYNPDTAQKRARCKHPWCTDCRKRRGRNYGNRNERHRVRMALARLTRRGQ